MKQGKNLKLCKIKNEDMKYIYKWFKDTEFLKFYDYLQPVPQTRENVDKTFSGYIDSEESAVFAVKLLNTDTIIGIVGFEDIIKYNKAATLFIGIGDKVYRGKGYGSEALNLLLDYGFNDMDLYRIQLNVLDFNKSAIKLYEKVGFKKEGVYREIVLREGRRYNMYLYGLLKREWKK